VIGRDSFFAGLTKELDSLIRADDLVLVIDRLAVDVHRAVRSDAEPIGQAATDLAQRHAGDGKLELLDFKTQPKPEDGQLMDVYERQLCTYGHILEHRHGRRPDRLLLYWTAEPTRAKALTVLPYRPERVDEAGSHFDEVVGCIQRREFVVHRPPERKICKECDIRALCAGEGIITAF